MYRHIEHIYRKKGFSIQLVIESMVYSFRKAFTAFFVGIIKHGMMMMVSYFVHGIQPVTMATPKNVLTFRHLIWFCFFSFSHIFLSLHQSESIALEMCVFDTHVAQKLSNLCQSLAFGSRNHWNVVGVG